jgi:glycine/D-amino acid oxidase-like deaminating enzyme
MRIGEGGTIAWTEAAEALAGDRGQVTPALQAWIAQVEAQGLDRFAPSDRAAFQDFVAKAGGKLKGPASMPRDRTPQWLQGPQPLAGFQSKPDLPLEADVVILGAGLTGASAALHLSRVAQRKSLKVVVLDAKDPGTGASGKNGGNFELIPENFFGDYGSYGGLEEERYKFLRAAYPDLSEDVGRAHARRTAEAIIKFALKNAARMKRTIEREKIECDFSPAGWLRTALNAEEAEAFAKEAALANRLGAKVELWSAQQIRDTFQFPSEHPGRMVKDNGNYHPFKLVTGELERALERGVELYTRTPVKRVQSLRPDRHLVETERGTIRAKKVIVATNAFTSQIFPELADIKPFRSQLAAYHHVEDHLHGVSVTAKDGDIYANFPGAERYLDASGKRRGTLIVGGGKDTPIDDPWDVQPDAEVFALSKAETEEHFPATEGQPAARAWAGPMAFVEGDHGMRLPVLGPLGTGPREGVFIAVWGNGYGGTGCHQTGAGAAAWAITGRIPKEMPQDVFGPQRLFTDRPQFG